MKRTMKFFAAAVVMAGLGWAASAAEPVRKTPIQAQTAVQPKPKLADVKGTPPAQPTTDPQLQPRNGQDQPPRSRDIIGGGSRNQGGKAPADGRLGGGSGLRVAVIADDGRKQPAGPAWRNREDHTGVKTAHPGDFGRDAMIKQLTDPTGFLPTGKGFEGFDKLRGAINSPQRPGVDDLGNRGGRKTIGDIWGSVNATPHNGDGKNEVSRRDQVGTTFRVDAEKDASTIVKPVHTEHPPTGTGERRNEKNEVVERVLTINGHCLHFFYENGQLVHTREYTPKNGDTTKTPTPDSVDDIHAPAGIRDNKPPKSRAEFERDRHRQVTLPGEGRGYDRVKVDKKELGGWIVGNRTSGNSMPVPTENTTPGGSSLDKVQRKKIRPDDPVDGLTGGSVGIGAKPTRPEPGPGGNETTGDGSTDDSSGGRPRRP